MKPDQQHSILESVVYWLEEAVIGLNLCPFAKSVWQQKSIRFAVSDAYSEETVLLDLYDECKNLEMNQELETTMLVCPGCFREFDDFNQFLGNADELLDYYNWRGVFQIASFHPQYQFAGTLNTDRENWTNRSPFPILHILRESSLERAISEHSAVDKVSERNIEHLRSLDENEFRRIFCVSAKFSK